LAASRFLRSFFSAFLLRSFSSSSELSLSLLPLSSDELSFLCVFFLSLLPAGLTYTFFSYLSRMKFSST